MSSSRSKRLAALEQVRKAQIQAQVTRIVDRAYDLSSPEQWDAGVRQFERQHAPEFRAAVKRLRAWGQGQGVPEVRDLGAAGMVWWKGMNVADDLAGLPSASPDTVTDLEQYAAQWRDAATREDCPEKGTAEELAGFWTWNAVLARAILEDAGEA